MGLFNRSKPAEPTTAEKVQSHFVEGAAAQKRFTQEPTTQGRLKALNEYSAHAETMKNLSK